MPKGVGYGMNPPKRNPGKVTKSAGSLRGMRGSNTPVDGAGERGSGRPKVAVRGSSWSANSLKGMKGSHKPKDGAGKR